ncbi:5-oxoprolinase subunit PxpB [Liquorilactobacillus capillatus]|uniref:Allophanate hydrolase 2 subunit 1 n=1 Tax=Liquorilactobacillus capillatus DSM 19910 TaxID=1423731 RepID=A0A0R1M1A2_9LACO|nr:5-oxoprolinase subunit PxpB [Liquorilactobacillus capillatus]KRL01740.1 allophanate hydrolase 2 subunit 1 [Liquorilactobacillus capillatus DSM 19910]
MGYNYQFVPVGEQSLNIVFDEVIDARENRLIHSLADVLIKTELGIIAVIPAYHTLTINFDIFQTDFLKLTTKITQIIKNHSLLTSAERRRIIEVPVCYDEEFGLDLKAVIEHGCITFDELIQMHTSSPYLIYMMGFMPGFAYMGSVADPIAMPRLKNPRAKVPAGSVAVAGKQTGMYPIEAPGGWRLLGRTPVRLYDPKHPEPQYYAGEYIKFKAISKTDYYYIQKLAAAGMYELKELN